jgi:hypothetical protein
MFDMWEIFKKCEGDLFKVQINVLLLKHINEIHTQTILYKSYINMSHINI